ncbi:MAG: cupin domain-containing protein [Ilumatobacteraceae bacterium]
MNGTFLEASSCAPALEPVFWEPTVFRSNQIDAEIERLCSLPMQDEGNRSSIFTHPAAPTGCPSLAPGIRVTLDVYLPGERSRALRQNSTVVGFCIRGEGKIVTAQTTRVFRQYDTWNQPSWRTHTTENISDQPLVVLTYSNAPLLEKLHVHIGEFDPPSEAIAASSPSAEDLPDDERRRSPFGTFELGSTGAMLMPYETLINPPVIVSPELLWPWQDVKEHLDRLESLGDSYVGRRLYLLYNPATGRTNGITPSFFAAITIRPPGVVDRPHRHVSAAINYFFRGSGYSRVGGRRYEWSAGDLMLTAPGWMIHNHASNADDSVYELTIQDQPLNIAMESLLWQEDLKRPARVLGSTAGFDTNRASLSAAT